MARKNKDVPVGIAEGTQEFATREFLAREKAAYEERTGETVKWELDHPLTITPLPEPVETVPEVEKVLEGETAETAEGEG